MTHTLGDVNEIYHLHKTTKLTHHQINESKYL